MAHNVDAEQSLRIPQLGAHSAYVELLAQAKAYGCKGPPH
jgi:hypothetical protein